MKTIKIIIITILLVGVALLVVGFLVPQDLKMPVVGATTKSYNHQTFWYEGWGSSVVHKGVDVFAKKGTPIHSSTSGIVISTGNGRKSGKFVLVLGPKWRIHYYAHMDKITTTKYAFVNSDTQIGTVGNTDNAATTPAHLHYSIVTLIPYPWLIDDAPMGWQKMFYLNPIEYFSM